MCRRPQRAGCLVAAALTAVSCAAADLGRTTIGGFEIEARGAKISSGTFPNISANPFARTTVTLFAVRHRGKSVVITDGKERVAEFWEAKVLDGASRPAILVAQTGAYLLTERQGELDVQVLAPATTDLARWQWLDSRNGQPGPEFNITIRNAGEESRLASGGRLLLVNRQRVLDVAALRSYPVAINSYENVELTGGYNAGNEQARALSPGGSQFVAVGSRYVDGAFDYAVVAVEYATGRLYAVPFDRNALRFQSVWDATPDWIAHYFEWSKNPDGREKLALRKSAQPLPWQGRFSRSPGGMVDYDLYPTEPAMQKALLEFVRREFAARDGSSPTGMADDANSKTVIVDGSPLRIVHFANDRRTALYADRTGTAPPIAGYALVERIGVKFNQTLASGRHDELFSTYPAGR